MDTKRVYKNLVRERRKIKFVQRVALTLNSMDLYAFTVGMLQDVDNLIEIYNRRPKG